MEWMKEGSTESSADLVRLRQALKHSEALVETARQLITQSRELVKQAEALHQRHMGLLQDHEDSDLVR